MLSPADLKRLQRLRDDDRARRDEGVFIVEVEKAVREFLREPRFAVELYVTAPLAGLPTDAPGRIAQRVVTENQMARITHLPSPSNALAVIRRPAETAPDFAAFARGHVLALDRVQDPGNVGTLVRVADWYGFAAVLLGEGCADPFSQKVVNASKGSLARIAVHRVDLPATLAAFPSGTPVLGCDLDGADLHAIAAPPAAVVVIGSEGRGLSPAVAACVTQRVTIPRFGGAESLNAAVAGAIVCDNLRRGGSLPARGEG